MRVLHETIARGSAATLNCRDFDLPVFDCPYHRHQEFEVLRIDASGGRVLAGDFVGRFEAGEIYVFGSRLPHSFVNRKGTREARSRCLQFDPERLDASMGELPELRPISRLYQKAGRGMVLEAAKAKDASELLDEVFAKEGVSQVAALLLMLECITKEEGFRMLASEGFKLSSPDRQLERLEVVLTRIHEHCSERLNVAELASLAGMSETAFHRHFRQRMGRTPKAYIQDVRLSNVAQRLLESEANISEIAFAEGFNNLSNFNHQFQRSFQYTPREYRARHVVVE